MDGLGLIETNLFGIIHSIDLRGFSPRREKTPDLPLNPHQELTDFCVSVSFEHQLNLRLMKRENLA